LELRVKKLKPGVVLPAFGRKGDAGFDLTANETVELKAGERKTVATGVAIAVPEHHVGFIMDRGGIALNKGLHCMAGVVDSNYRGEWKIVMINLNKEPVIVEKGTRIAQGLIVPLLPLSIAEVKELDETGRGEKGFGSSGH
jgi:dUTP pyrophosphatase